MKDVDDLGSSSSPGQKPLRIIGGWTHRTPCWIGRVAVKEQQPLILCLSLVFCINFLFKKILLEYTSFTMLLLYDFIFF